MTSFNLKTPVALIIFNRPETTEKVFEAIRQAKPPQLFVIADGPRPNRQGETENCAAARAIINRVDWRCEVFANYSQINLGCRQRIYSGLNWVFERVESAIILEDDCIPHPSFFQFCEELLEKYRMESKIFSISGDNFQFGNNPTEDSYYFSRYPHCWGWATWRRAWQYYDDKMSLWHQFRDSNWLENIFGNAEAVRYWSNIFDSYEKFNSWAYIWAFSCWSRNGLTILPRVNLISNIGFNSEATHTSSPSRFAKMATEAINFPLKHPASINRNLTADDFTEKIMFSGSHNLSLEAATGECKVCGSQSHKFDRAQILNKYSIDYFQCSNCGFIQTETPYWLAEAYAEPIASSDVGLVARNLELSQVAENLILNLFNRQGKFLDYGCGYGLFVRLMRESGFDCYGYDAYCQNIFYQGFEAGKNPGEKYEFVAAFEVLEHLVNPLEEIEKILQFSRNFFFSTKLLPDYNPKPKDWWYFALDEGQHISIYTKEALSVIAKKFNLNFYSYGASLHLLTEKEIEPSLFQQLCRIDPRIKKPKQLTEAEYLQEIEAMKNAAPSQKKLKVLVDGVFFQLNNTGIARVWISLLSAWVADGFAGNILVLDRGETAPKIPGVRYRNIPRYDYGKTKSDRKMLQQVCDEEKADLFISTYYTTPVSTPSIFMAYDMVPEVFASNLNHPEWREKHEGIRRAVSYITISENTARDLIKYFPQISSNSVTVAHCGVDSKFSPARKEEIANFQSKYGLVKPYFLVIGERVGWQNYKNTILLFRAFSQLANNRELEIVCVGGKSILEPELARYVFPDSVKILQLSDEELKAAYSGAVALVYPSKYEGFGMPIVEAMACGCPVITCRNSALPEVAGEAAIYVGDRNFESLANALVEIQKPQIRQQLIAAGLKQAQKFSWSKMANIVSSVLENTANRITSASEKLEVNEAQLTLQRQFWNVNSLDEAMFGRVLAYEGIDKLSPEERRQAWEKSILTWSLQILQGIPAQPEWKVLEIGCGVGRLVKHFREKFARVDGVDISEKMIEFAKQYLADGKQNGEVYANNGSDLQQLPDTSYDFVFSTIVFQHIRSVSIVKSYFREIFRVLKPGGYFRIQVHDRTATSLGSFDEEGSPDKQYFFSGNAYTDEQLKQLLLEAGFNLISLECSKPWIWATVQREATSSSPLFKGGWGGSYSPKVSAIISTYKSEKFIRGCLEDLVNQTLYKQGELEIIIIDSASPEKEGSIASEFQTEYPGIIYHRTAERETLYTAWNRGIKLAKGEYITNANTDDRHRPDALEKMANYLEKNSDAGVVYADQLITANPHETWETTKANQRWNWPSFDYSELEKRCILGSQPMWRKSLHEKYGYFRDEFSVAGDYEFWLRIGKVEKIVRLPEILGLYYDNRDGLEKADAKASEETHQIWNEYGTLRRGVVPKASVPVSISESELNSLLYRQGQPLVSVIIPCYNYARYLPEAVESVVKQSYRNWECIIVNDGSPDNTTEVAKSLIGLYGSYQIKLIEKTNSGVAEARNAGISQSTGAYILCLDADDKIHHNFLKETIAILQAKERVGFVYTDFQHIGTSEDLVRQEDFNPEKFLRSNQASVTSLFRREIFQQVGGFKKVMAFGWEDWEFWVAAYELGWLGDRLPKPYLFYRQHSQGSRQQQIHSSELFQAVHNALIIKLHSQLYTRQEVEWSQEILRRHGSVLGIDLDREIPPSPPSKGGSLELESQAETGKLAVENREKEKIEFPSIYPVAENIGRPFFSVMIPTYNPAATFLEQTLKSVLDQDPGAGEMQIEVVDDCSTESDVEEIVNKIGRGRISFSRQGQNLGQISNWNDCIQRARGEWVHILHQDDLVLPGFYRQMGTHPLPLPGGEIEVGSQTPVSHVGAAFCRYYYIDSAGKQRFLSPIERETPGIIDDFIRRIAVQQRIQFATILVKRSVYQELGGFCPQAASAADWEMWKRIAARYPVFYEPQILACFRLHSFSETSRLMQSGENIANARKAIEISKLYLPKTMVEELSNKAGEYYALEAMKMGASMLKGGDADSAIAQFREGLKCSQSQSVVNLLVSVLLNEKNTTSPLSQTDQEVSSTKNSPLFKGGWGGSSSTTQKLPKVIIDGVMFQIYESGITRVWRSLLEEWAAQDFGKQILVLDRNGTAPKIAGIMYRAVPAYDYNQIEADRQMLQEICDEVKADIFVSTYYTTPVSTPSVFMAYDLIPEIMGANLENPMWKQKHDAINRASAYLAISENTARDLVRYFPKISPAAVTVAKCGVNQKFYPANFLEVSNFQNKYGIAKPYFLWVGDRIGFNGYKNAQLFFQALSRYPQKQQVAPPALDELASGSASRSAQKVEIVCVGGTSELEAKLAEYAGDIKVNLLKLSDDELQAAYSGALALVQTSKYEGFGLPLLEAMACGCPVITCANGSIPEVVGKAALYVGDSDVNELLKAMLEIQQPEIRQPLITAGLERAKNFSWGAMANAVSSALIKTANSVLSESTRTHPQPLPGGEPEGNPPPAPPRRGAGGEPTPSPSQEGSGEFSAVAVATNLLPSLGEIEKAIATYQNNRSDKSALENVRQIRKQIAEFCLNIATTEELSTAYNRDLGKAHQALLTSGIKDEALTDSEKIFAQQLSTNIAQGFDQPLALQYLLAGMLYQRADQVPLKYQRAPIPKWFATDYLKFMFASPQLFQEIGEADNYHQFLSGWLSYVHQNIAANPESQLWGAIAWLFVKNSNWIPLYFTSTANLKELYIQRADIIKFALKNRGVQLDYQFGTRSNNREKIRLGILKDHYSPQTETYAILPVFEHLDRSQFEIFLYAVKTSGGTLEQYCQSRADKLMKLPSEWEAQVQAIRNDDLDILFIGSNVTAGMKNSTLLAMHRLARVQVTSINSPTTTGMRHVDYYIAGKLTAATSKNPPLSKGGWGGSSAQDQYREKLLNLEGSGICFRYPLANTNLATVRPIRASWGATEETVIFISGANFYKIIPELRETWAKIVAAVPNSILVLYPFNPNWTSSYRAMPFVEGVRSVFAKHGLARQRLVVIKALPSQADIKECLQLADVYLDSFPYSGATSLLDPLLVGVPPVVVEGDALRFRQASALLREIGQDDLIAGDEEGYINLAMKLATDSQWREQKREQIQRTMGENPPFLDSRGYSAQMGGLLQKLWRQWQGDLGQPVSESVENQTSRGERPFAPTEEFLNRLLGCVNLYEIDPSDESLVSELKQLRRQFADFWMETPTENLPSVYRGPVRQCYQRLLGCGFQNESMTAEEEQFLQGLVEISAGLTHPQAVNALLGAMLFFVPGKMRVRDARQRLPEWLVEDYEGVFEWAIAPKKEVSTVAEGQLDPPQPPLARGEQEENFPRSPLERGEQEENLSHTPHTFVKEVLGSVNLFYIDPSDESVIARLRILRREMADLCLQVADGKLESFYQSETGRAYRGLLGCGLQNLAMTSEEGAFLQELAIALGKGIQAPNAINHLLAAMLYCRRGQLQVEDVSQLPQWLSADYQKFVSGESAPVLAG